MRTLCWMVTWTLLLGGARADEQALDAGSLRLNEIQVVATHNSYHLRPPAQLLKAAMALHKDAKEWDYSRQPLDEQLDQGIRSFELDLHLSGDEWLVIHVPTFDPGSTVRTFREGLEVIRDWSNAHPRHVPISVLVELKSEGYQLNRAFRRPEPADVLRLDEEIRETFAPEQLLTPDDVRGSHATLYEAIRSGGWPTLADAAGRVMIILHERGPHRGAYLDGHPALEGRAMFVESDLSQPHSAVLIRNNPLDPRLDELAGEGYLIRTRVDTQSDLRPQRRERALAGGAHLLTTDHPRGEIDEEQAFSLPHGAAARVHPITGPEDLRGVLISEPLGEAAGS